MARCKSWSRYSWPSDCRPDKDIWWRWRRRPRGTIESAAESTAEMRGQEYGRDARPRARSRHVVESHGRDARTRIWPRSTAVICDRESDRERDREYGRNAWSRVRSSCMVEKTAKTRSQDVQSRVQPRYATKSTVEWQPSKRRRHKKETKEEKRGMKRKFQKHKGRRENFENSRA